jgi:hypothetical protein
MKLCHAAALALVGWYLLAPPNVWVGKEDRVDETAPLDSWIQLGSYDTAVRCQQALDQINAKVYAAYEKDKRARHPFQWRLGVDAKCVATDDPRLKEQ